MPKLKRIRIAIEPDQRDRSEAPQPMLLRIMLDATGNTQAALTRATDAKRGAVSFHATGRRLPPLRELARYAEVLGYRLELIAVPLDPAPPTLPASE